MVVALIATATTIPIAHKERKEGREREGRDKK
jgi:hypothetical protein